MKGFLCGLAALACTSFALAQQPATDRAQPERSDKATAPDDLNGTWTVLCVEKDGKPVPDCKSMTVTIKDNVITCSGKDGKEPMTMKVTFTKPGHATVTDQTANGANTAGNDGKDATKKAVYVLTSDFLAVCVHPDDKATAGTDTSATDRSASTGGSDKPFCKGQCSIVLKRGGSEKGERTDR